MVDGHASALEARAERRIGASAGRRTALWRAETTPDLLFSSHGLIDPWPGWSRQPLACFLFLHFHFTGTGAETADTLPLLQASPVTDHNPGSHAQATPRPKTCYSGK
jgi:hypothetical protein